MTPRSISFPYDEPVYAYWVSLLGTTQFHIESDEEDYHFHFGVIICEVHRYSLVLKPEEGYSGIRVSFEDVRKFIDPLGGVIPEYSE